MLGLELIVMSHLRFKLLPMNETFDIRSMSICLELSADRFAKSKEGNDQMYEPRNNIMHESLDLRQ